MSLKPRQLQITVGIIIACVALVLVWRTRTPQPGAGQAAPSVEPVPTAASAQPASAAPAAQAEPVSDEARIAALEALAATDYNAALVQALRETNEERRSNFLQAVIRGWASKDIRAAGFWARTQPYLFRDLALAAVFNGGAKNPEEAEKYAQELSASDAKHAVDYGNYLVHGLGLAGHHRAAAKFAEGYKNEMDQNWFVGAYHTWGKDEPRLALAATEAIGDPQKQRIARQCVYSGWSKSNPAELAKIAINYPEGEERKVALMMSLRMWVGKDPIAAAEWMATQKFTPEMEAALEE